MSSAFKIKNRDTGLFYRGAGVWSKHGKLYDKIGHVKNAIHISTGSTKNWVVCIGEFIVREEVPVRQIIKKRKGR